MKDINIYEIFKEFINNEKYNIYLKNIDKEFNNKLDELKKYIDDNKTKPTQSLKEHNKIQSLE